MSYLEKGFDLKNVLDVSCCRFSSIRVVRKRDGEKYKYGIHIRSMTAVVPGTTETGTIHA